MVTLVIECSAGIAPSISSVAHFSAVHLILGIHLRIEISHSHGENDDGGYIVTK